MHGAIIRYLGRLSKETLSDELTARLHDSMAAANYLENIGDIIEKDLLPIAAKRRRLNIAVSEETEAKLAALEKAVCDAFEQAITAIASGDADQAVDVLESKAAVLGLAEEASAQLALRLSQGAPHGLDALRQEGVDIAVTYGDPAFYGRVGFNPVSEADLPAPQPLNQPQGWIAQSLTDAPMTPLRGLAHCVTAFNDPSLW